MSNKVTKEWFVEAPWGKLALISWGDCNKPPILMVHGYMDTAATFIPLLEVLPDEYYYVSFDIPGLGKSDPFPPGVIFTQLHIVEPIRQIVAHMKWNSFICLCHSMGAIISGFYHHLYPGHISKMMHIDPGPALAMYYFAHHKPTYWFQFIDGYYSNYHSYNSKTVKLYTYDEAVNLVMRNRTLSEEKSEVILSRSLIPVGEGKYRMSWDPRMKKISSLAVSEETLFNVLTKDIPPTLIMIASENISMPQGRRFAAEILDKCKSMFPNFYSATVSGGHDVHITDPELIAPYIIEFLNSGQITPIVISKL